MPVATISMKNGRVRFIDQTQLPGKLAYVSTDKVERLWRAIKHLEVRGAPAIGIAGAFGVVIGVQREKTKDRAVFLKKVSKVARYLASSRPTAVNLFWAVERMERAALLDTHATIPEIKVRLLEEAQAIFREDQVSCRMMARYGALLVKSGDTILTHCNAGGLATAGYGTALGVLFESKRQGKRIRVYADETRPLLQGARLTAWELLHEGIDATLICDNMAASIMAKRKVDKIFVGADRIARNGDTANKIGTYSLAVLAKYHRVPFYVVAPSSTFDHAIETGADIPIEERDPDEVRTVLGKVIAPQKVKVYNPAFDVTPHELISAIITEKGIFRQPYLRTLRDMERA